MSQYFIDWNKTPEIKFIKKKCPICRQPTGPDSRCYELDLTDEYQEDSDNSNFDIKLSVRTLEIDGAVESILSEQCFFRRHKMFFMYTNIPISQPMCLVLGRVEGIEKLNIFSPYRAEIVIGEQFDDSQILMNIEKAYTEFCLDKRNRINQKITENLLQDNLDEQQESSDSNLDLTNSR